MGFISTFSWGGGNFLIFFCNCAFPQHGAEQRPEQCVEHRHGVDQFDFKCLIVFRIEPATERSSRGRLDDVRAGIAVDRMRPVTLKHKPHEKTDDDFEGMDVINLRTSSTETLATDSNDPPK